MKQKSVLLIGTGGTIASELGDNGLAPELTSEQLLKYIPDLEDTCRVACTQVCSLDSTEMRPEHWVQIAETIRRSYHEYDGFVICHGTDTMAYTAAGLSYLIQNSPKPIVLTGSQKPIGFETTDSKQNLRDAFAVAVSDMPGVMVVFSDKIIAGTRARKTHSKRFEAFSSINYPFLGQVRDGRIFPFIRLASAEEPVFYRSVDPKVALLKLIPGMDCGAAEYLLSRNDALIIESFGVGGLPSYGDGGYFSVVRAGLAAGKFIVMTTQVENEGCDLGVYSVGARVRRSLPVLEAYDMTTEAVAAKLMWILGQTSDPAQVEEMFYTPVACDMLGGFSAPAKQGGR